MPAGCANCRAEQLSPSMVMDVSSGARTLIPTTLGRALMSPTRDSLSTRPGGRRAWDGPFAVMFSTRRVRTVTGRCSSIRWSKPILPRFACGALSAFSSLPLCQRGFVIQRMDTLAFILCIGRFETERRTFISAEAEIAVQPSVCPAVRLSASQATAWAGVGRLARAASGACLTGCTPEGASVTWPRGLTLVRASSGAATGGAALIEAVQHESTATHPDRGGRAGTREDGDLRGWTQVDVLPPDGMQEVSGSSPLSSTPGQTENWNAEPMSLRPVRGILGASSVGSWSSDQR